MQNNLIQFESSNVTITPYSIEFKQGTPWSEWKSIFDKLNDIHGMVQFYVGDCINYGEWVYGATYKKAMENSPYDYFTLAQFARISKRYSPEFRERLLEFYPRGQISYTLLRILAPLEDPEILDYVRRAAEGGWSSRRLEAEIAKTKPQPVLKKVLRWFVNLADPRKREEILSIRHVDTEVEGEKVYVLTSAAKLPELTDGLERG